MLEHHDKLNGSATAFIRAFSDLIKESTSHLATREDLDRMAANMATKDDIANMATKSDIADMATKSDMADMVTREDLNERIDTTKQNMQAQFAQQERKIAELDRKFSGVEMNISEINQKLDRISR